MPRKPKAARAADTPPLDATPAPARRGRPPRAKAAPKPVEAENNGASTPDLAETTAEPVIADMMAEPEALAEVPTEPAAAEAAPAEPTPSPAGTAPSKPAARWDPAADTVQFDWPAIEQTASQPGPNQVMAKLLVAARAEGANSRWPFGEG